MRYKLSILVCFISFSVFSQADLFFNIDVLKQRKKEGVGINAFTSTRAALVDNYTEDAKFIQELPPFQQVELLHFYKGKFGVFVDNEYGFVEEASIIVDYKVESHKSVWEAKIKSQLREEEIKQRRLAREKRWNEDFGETNYASGEGGIKGGIVKPGTYSYAVAYNFNVKNESPTSIVRNNKLTPRVMIPGRELTSAQLDDFFDILYDTMNYGRKPNRLFNPKIGVVFYSSSDQIVNFIDIDLDNRQLKATSHIPSMEKYIYNVDDNGVVAENSSDSVKHIDLSGFTREGYEDYMEYFRLLKLNVSSYPNQWIFGGETYWSHTGYDIEIPKITAAVMAMYGRNMVSFGPKYWIGDYYGFNGKLGFGVQLSYKYYLSPYGRRFKAYATYDFDYGFSRVVESEVHQTFVRKFIEQNRYLNNAVGIGFDYRVYKYYSLFFALGIGKGLNGFTNKLVNDVYPNENYSNTYGFFKGAFFDSPSLLVKIGINYRHIIDN
jgi:hypothetical protein